MANPTKLFILLEEFKFPPYAGKKLSLASSSTNTTTESAHCRADRMASNMKILEKYEKLNDAEQLKKLYSVVLRSPPPSSSISSSILNDEVSIYIVRLQHMLLSLTSNIKFNSDAKEDLISVAHLKLCIQTVQELGFYALRCQLHNDFYKSAVFKEAENVAPLNKHLLFLSIEFFMRFLLPIRQFHIANGMELVLRDLMATIITLKTLNYGVFQSQLDKLWHQESKTDFFRNILLLKANRNLSLNVAMLLHRQLLNKLQSPQGLANFVWTLQQIPNANAAHNAEIIASIVERSCVTAVARERMIYQIYNFCKNFPADSSAVVLSLRRLYEKSPRSRQIIDEQLVKHWQPLVSPEDVLTGLIVIEQSQLFTRIAFWQRLFCSSSVACLPSALLVPYLPLLLQLYDNLPPDLLAATPRSQLVLLITRCLDNREGDALATLLHQLFLSSQLPAEWQSLHQRILIAPTTTVGKATTTTVLSIKIGPADYQAEFNVCNILPNLLMESQHHELTYKVFMVLVRLLVQQLDDNKVNDSLLSSESELMTFLEDKYKLKVELLIALNTLVSFQPLKSQLSSHSKEFMQLLRELLNQRISTSSSDSSEITDQILLLILTLLQELLEQSDNLEDSTRLLQSELQSLNEKTANRLVQHRVKALLSLLNGEWKAPDDRNSQRLQAARALIEQSESHLQVYGIQMLLQLLREKDEATMSQGHLLIALALATLKQKESYTFLNCVRLFVALVHVMEAEVLDKISEEYLSETADLDYRLVVGEAILKVAKEIGPLCYKYKAELLNCFMHGTRSPVNEFRMSAFANLAQLCRLLTYQVQNFFAELMQLIDAELSTGKYLPAKRAAVLVLAELLDGMDNLLDFEEMLLPIYRLLRVIEAAENCDPQMRQHAANGLKILNKKCKELLTPSEEQLVKEIKVLGIKDKPQRTGQKHILELN